MITDATTCCVTEGRKPQKKAIPIVDCQFVLFLIRKVIDLALFGYSKCVHVLYVCVHIHITVSIS